MIRTFLLVLLSVLGLRVEAAEPAGRLQRFLQDVTSLSARFEQTQLGDDGQVIATRGGSFQLARPGRFRWHYDTPYEQLMVCDGERIWNYETDLAQVTVRDARDILRDTPVALLAQGQSLDDRFSVTEAGMEGEVQRLNLNLKAIWLTHAHIDHSGRLPFLVAEGFSKTIWATAATRDLCAVMLADSAHIQEKDAEFVNKRRFRRSEQERDIASTEVLGELLSECGLPAERLAQSREAGVERHEEGRSFGESE